MPGGEGERSGVGGQRAASVNLKPARTNLIMSNARRLAVISVRHSIYTLLSQFSSR